MLRIQFPWQRGQASLRRAAEVAYKDLMRAALAPHLYEPGWVPDKFDARAGMVTAHSAVMMVRLREVDENKALKLAEEVNQLILDGFDAAHRERGVGDSSIARKVRKMAENHSGAGKALVAALGAEDGVTDAVAAVLERNGYTTPEGARPVAEKMLACLTQFREQPDADILDGRFEWTHA